MAKSKGTRNIKEKKNDKRKIEQRNIDFEKYVFKILVIFIGVLLFLAIFYFITVGIVSNKDDEDNNDETTIQYQEILAGSSFNMSDSEYYVVYYEFDDEELADFTSTIYNYSYMGTYKLYTVNMNDGFNKKYVAEDDSNPTPGDASDLAIKGPTLIKVIEGDCVEYVEGVDKITDYLK